MVDVAIEAFDLVGTAFSAVYDWFVTAMFESGMMSYYLAAFFLLLVARFLLRPIFGGLLFSAGSDVVKGVRYEARPHGKYESNYYGKYHRS